MKSRVALILPWAGPLPWYYGLFEASVKNAGLDLILIHESVSYFKERAEKALNTPVGLTAGYKLCDLKPLLGKIFAAELAGYDYWAFGDCDVVYGRKMADWIRMVTDGNWDVATTRTDWVTGAFTLMRNCEKVNSLYERSPSWRAIVADPQNHAFDEQGYMNWSVEVRRGVTTLEEQRRTHDSFGSVVWAATDVRFLHEEVMCENGVGCGECVRMAADGELTYDGREICAFHMFDAKQLLSFRRPCLSASEVGAYTLAAGGYFPGAKISRAVTYWRKMVGTLGFACDWLVGKASARQRVHRVIRRVVLRRERWWDV